MNIKEIDTPFLLLEKEKIWVGSSKQIYCDHVFAFYRYSHYIKNDNTLVVERQLNHGAGTILEFILN